jgi:hypothetical protein
MGQIGKRRKDKEKGRQDKHKKEREGRTRQMGHKQHDIFQPKKKDER